MDTLTTFLILLTAAGVASGILEWRKLKKKGQESYKNKEYSTATVHQENSSDQGDNASDSGGGGA